jgi:hypothetical protein
MRTARPFSRAPDGTYRLQALPDTLEYTGEFGSELLLFLPFCAWLASVSILRHHAVKTYRGMGCFYQDLDCREIIEKNERRMYVPPHRRGEYLPVRNEHYFDGGEICPLHVYPNLRKQFGVMPMVMEVEKASRPLLIVHNKYNNEWGKGPINYISLEVLDLIFKRYARSFTIVYVRHCDRDVAEGFSVDSLEEAFDDFAVVRRHPDVLSFRDLYQEHKCRGGVPDINLFKNMLYSRCYRFISAQGGGAHHICLFPGSLLMVLHRAGQEERWAYYHGYYKFASNPAPILIVCRRPEELVSALPLLEDAISFGDRLLLGSRSEELLRQVSTREVAERNTAWPQDVIGACPKVWG